MKLLGANLDFRWPLEWSRTRLSGVLQGLATGLQEADRTGHLGQEQERGELKQLHLDFLKSSDQVKTVVNKTGKIETVP